MQVDILVKKNGKLVLGVEADGLFWHSEAMGKTPQYHLSKTDACKAAGI